MSGTAISEPGLRGRPVLVTGATGGVGRPLVEALAANGAEIAVLTRSPGTAGRFWPGRAIACRAGDLTRPGSLAGALAGIELVFHLASHRPPAGERQVYEAPAHWTVTAEGTRALLDEALRAGVRRMVLVSSVLAAAGSGGTASRAGAAAKPPGTLYGRAKRAAEDAVLAAARAGRIEASVLRLPMVYGIPGQGNLERLIDAIARRRCPPWPRIENRRSAVHVDDAAAAAIRLALHPAASAQVYTATDGQGYSTRWLYEQIHRCLGRPLPRWTLPLPLWRLAAGLGSLFERATGRRAPLTRAQLEKLAGDAWFDAEGLTTELGFAPRHRLAETLPALVRARSRAAARGGTGADGRADPRRAPRR